MTIDIQALIERRPHLKDPLELYAKWQRFQHEVTAILSPRSSVVSQEVPKAYPPETVGQVFGLFTSIFNLPDDELAPLCRALEDGEVDFMQFPVDQFPAFSALPFSEEELAGLLFLLSRPYFLALRETFPLDGSEWENGHCPLCSAKAALSSVIEGPKRLLHCSFCGTVGPYRFIGCPNCETVDAAKLNTIVSDDEPGFRIVTCDECHTYVKIMESPVLKEMGMDLADMVSLPLDIVAQEKGFMRMVPNPISLKKMG